MSVELLTTTPFTRINDSIHFDQNINEIVNSVILSDIEHDGGANVSKTHHQFLDIQKSFLYVCTETVFNYPHAYLSEKSYKGITVKRPFVILGAPGSLQLLKDYGFKTFSQWWDESYDNEKDSTRRMQSVYAIIKNVCDYSNEKLKELCGDMSQTLEYNYEHYKTFSNNQILEFDRGCLDNLNR
jgi:hypothetical protein